MDADADADDGEGTAAEKSLNKRLSKKFTVAEQRISQALAATGGELEGTASEGLAIKQARDKGDLEDEEALALLLASLEEALKEAGAAKEAGTSTEDRL